MKAKLILALLALAILGALLWNYLPKNPGGGGPPDQDSVTRAALERSRDSTAAAARDSALIWAVRDSVRADSLARAEQRRQLADVRARTAQRRADSLATVLARTKDDDDLLVVQAAENKALREANTALREQVAADSGVIGQLAADTSDLRGRIRSLNTENAELIRQRDGYRALAKRCRWFQVTAGYGGVQADGLKMGPGIMAGVGCRV